MNKYEALDKAIAEFLNSKAMTDISDNLDGVNIHVKMRFSECNASLVKLRHDCLWAKMTGNK